VDEYMLFVTQFVFLCIGNVMFYPARLIYLLSYCVSNLRFFRGSFVMSRTATTGAAYFKTCTTKCSKCVNKEQVSNFTETTLL